MEDERAVPETFRSTARRLGAALVVLAVLFLAGLIWLNRPPADFVPTEITIDPGTSTAEIVDLLEAGRVVRSADLLYAALLIRYDPSDIHAGVFVFDAPLTTIAVAQLLATTAPRDELLSVTFPEGFSVYEFADFLPPPLAEQPVTLDIPAVEGYLFPDTYFVPPTFSPADLAELMQATFAEKIAPLEPWLASSSLTLPETVTLASLIEREGKDQSSMRLISGILHNRLRIGMPLQVDAAVAYGLRKPGTDLTGADLDVDGPYNTYTRAGLPPTPIANPGLRALKAALDPEPTEYLYYLTAPDGTFHYAKTLEEHNQNVARYLR